MIYTVTLNPSLDRTIRIPAYEPGSIHRAELVRMDYGGKGINVSRALRGMGVSSVILAAFGGRTGQILEQGLRNDGYDITTIQTTGETRQNITIVKENNPDCDKYNEPGAVLDSEAVLGLKKAIKALADPGSVWAFCGSLPPGADISLYTELIGLVQNQGGKVFLDTSSAALGEGIKASPFCVKPNIEELVQINPQLPQGDFIACLDYLSGRGIQLPAVSGGARGLAVRFQGESWLAVPPDVDVKSNIGAGDAALAGLIWGFTQGQSARDLARSASAFGTACVMQEGTGMGDRDLIFSLMKETKMVRLG